MSGSGVALSAFVPELGWTVGERLRVVDVYCNTANGALLDAEGVTYHAQLGFPVNTISLAVASIDGVIDMPPGIASSEAAMTVSEGIPLDTNIHEMLYWVENNVRLSARLPATFTPITSISANNNTWTVTTSVPHDLLVEDVALNLSFAICGVRTDGWAVLTSVVDPTTLVFTVPYAVVAVYNQEAGDPLQLYLPSLTTEDMAGMISSRMTLTSATAGRGWTYTLNIKPYVSLAVTGDVSVRQLHQTMNITLYEAGYTSTTSTMARLGFAARQTATNQPNSVSVIINASGALQLGVPMVLGRVPVTPGDMASITENRLNFTGFAGTYTYEVLIPGGATGFVALNPASTYLPLSLARLFSFAGIVQCIFTGGSFNFVAQTPGGDAVRITFSDFSTARRLGLPTTFVCNPLFNGNEQNPPLPCSSMSSPYLPLTLDYTAQIEPIGGRLMLSAARRAGDPIVSFVVNTPNSSTVSVTDTAALDPVPYAQIVEVVDTAAVPPTAAFFVVTGIVNNATNKDVSIVTHSTYAFVGPAGTLATASSDPAEARFNVYNAADLGFGNLGNGGGQVPRPVISGFDSQMFAYSESANISVWYESTDGSAVTAMFPPPGSGTAKPTLYVQIESQEANVPPTGGVWRSVNPPLKVTSAVDIDPGSRMGYGDGYVTLSQQTRPAYPSGGEPTRAFRFTFWDVTNRPWSNMGFPFRMRLRITSKEVEAVHPPREPLPGNPVAFNYPRGE